MVPLLPLVKVALGFGLLDGPLDMIKVVFVTTTKTTTTTTTERRRQLASRASRAGVA